MDAHEIYHSDHSTIYTNIKSLCYAWETNMILCVCYNSIKTEKN